MRGEPLTVVRRVEGGTDSHGNVQMVDFATTGSMGSGVSSSSESGSFGGGSFSSFAKSTNSRTSVENVPSS